MNNWKIILATAAIFGAGLATGAVLVRQAERIRTHQRSIQQAPPRPFFGPGGNRLELLRRMERDLDLSPEQRQKIDRILQESQERSRRLMEPINPQLREEVKRAKAEFREALTPAQQERFDTLLKQQHSRDPRSPREHRPGQSPRPNPAP